MPIDPINNSPKYRKALPKLDEPKTDRFAGMYGGNPGNYNPNYTPTNVNQNPYQPNWNEGVSNDPSLSTFDRGDFLQEYGEDPNNYDRMQMGNPEEVSMYNKMGKGLKDFGKKAWKNRSDIAQGLLYGADMIASNKNEYRQDMAYENAFRNRMQQDPLWDYNAMYGNNQPLIKAEEGAQVRKPGIQGMPIEIEGGEFLILPDGTAELARGPKHKNGGIPTILPDKSIVYSNKLMPHGSKETFAKIAKKQDFTTELKTLQNPFASEVAKNSAQRMYDRKRKTLSEIFQMQQIMNGNSSGEPKGMSQENEGSEQPPMNPNEGQMMMPMGQPNEMMARGGLIEQEFQPVYTSNPNDPRFSNYPGEVLYGMGGPYYEPYNVQYANGGTPSPVNPNYTPASRTTGIPYLYEPTNVYTHPTPLLSTIPGTTNTSETPVYQTKWFRLDGTGNNILVDGKYITRDEFEKYKSTNPNFNYSQLPDSVGRTYANGGYYNNLYEYGGVYFEDGGMPNMYAMGGPITFGSNPVKPVGPVKPVTPPPVETPPANSPSNECHDNSCSGDAFIPGTLRPEEPIIQTPTPPSDTTIIRIPRFGKPSKPSVTTDYDPTGGDEDTTGDYNRTTTTSYETPVDKPVTTTPAAKPAPARVVWYTLAGNDKILMDGKYYTFSEYDDYVKNNPQHKYSTKPDSSGNVYRTGKGVVAYSEGGVIDASVMKLVEFKDGGMYINPKNKGKFTAWAQSKGMSVQEAASQVMANKENYSPTTVKRANFAKNASTFKHEMGGTIEYAEGGVYDMDDQEIERLRKLGYEIEIG